MENLINSSRLPFDIRAEVLARILAEKYNLSTEQILFQPKNYFQRWGRRDVLEIAEGHSFKLDKTTLLLEVCREGMFDTLPESIFFHPEDKYGDSLDRVKKLSEQEAAGRQFLLPFEQLFYWLRLENENREFRAENEIEQWWQTILSTSTDMYSPLKDTLLDEEQKAILIQLLPHLPDIVGNWTLTEQWLSLFLKTAIRIVELSPPQYTLPEHLQTRLGSGLLGQDFVIGTTFSDGIPSIQILIEGLTADTIGAYLPSGKNRILLEEELLKILLPIETPYDISLKLNRPSKEFQVGTSSNNSILGYTTVLEDIK